MADACLCLHLPTSPVRLSLMLVCCLPVLPSCAACCSCLLQPPVGWWSSMQVVGGPFCGMRDFPPPNNGYGSARLLCQGAYDHYWQWKLLPVSG